MYLMNKIIVSIKSLKMQETFAHRKKNEMLYTIHNTLSEFFSFY